jgi:hypothetical protein
MGKKKITFDIIFNKYLNGEYEPPIKVGSQPKQLVADYVIDENQTVKWNRAEVVRLNKEARKEFDKMLSLKKTLADQYRADLASAAANEYGINSAQATKIYTHVMNNTEHDYISVEFTVDYEKFCKFFAILRDTKE